MCPPGFEEAQPVTLTRARDIWQEKGFAASLQRHEAAIGINPRHRRFDQGSRPGALRQRPEVKAPAYLGNRAVRQHPPSLHHNDG